jgi:hypothetical protein
MKKMKKIFPPIHHLDSNNAFILNLSKTSFTAFLGSSKFKSQILDLKKKYFYNFMVMKMFPF